MTVLVTGSNGTIGTGLCLRLLDAGHDVTGVDRQANQWSEAVDALTSHLDLTERASLETLPQDVDVVVHLAAKSRVKDLIETPSRAKENLITTFNVLEYVREVDADLIFASSREVYGERDETVLSEEQTSADNSENPYAASKVAGEALVDSYRNAYGVAATVLRFSNVYGRFDVSDRVVPLFVAKAATDAPLTVYGAEKVLDFVHIDDVVTGIERSVERFETARGEAFNVASGTGTSLLELAETIRSEVGSDVKIAVEPSQPGEIGRFVAEITKTERMLGYEPQHELADGIGRTVQWYDEHDLYDRILASDDW